MQILLYSHLTRLNKNWTNVSRAVTIYIRRMTSTQVVERNRLYRQTRKHAYAASSHGYAGHLRKRAPLGIPAISTDRESKDNRNAAPSGRVCVGCPAILMMHISPRPVMSWMSRRCDIWRTGIGRWGCCWGSVGGLNNGRSTKASRNQGGIWSQWGWELAAGCQSNHV